MSWDKFLRTAITSFTVLVAFVYALILLVDPYQNVPFSLPLERAPISTNQRFAYPALARDPRFDAVRTREFLESLGGAAVQDITESTEG